MNHRDRTILVVGSLSALLGVGAGAAEILAGTVSWAGNKHTLTKTYSDRNHFDILMEKLICKLL